MSSTGRASLLADLTHLEPRPAVSVESFGSTLVIAPHPDDESLGCGGAIRLLRDRGLSVHVVFVTDGTGSHPHSCRYPPPLLGSLRRLEALRALCILGVAPDQVRFLALVDRCVPGPEHSDFGSAVSMVSAIIDEVRPATILLPWRRDPHGDHRASWQIVMAAVSLGGSDFPRIFEYAVWLWELGEEPDWPGSDEARAWRLNISSVVAAKRAAIACHASQTTDLIDDDPGGFRLPQALIDRCTADWELYVEPR